MRIVESRQSSPRSDSLKCLKLSVPGAARRFDAKPLAQELCSRRGSRFDLIEEPDEYLMRRNSENDFAGESGSEVREPGTPLDARYLRAIPGPEKKRELALRQARAFSVCPHVIV